jgi:hypothetical protein
MPNGTGTMSARRAASARKRPVSSRTARHSSADGINRQAQRHRPARLARRRARQVAGPSGQADRRASPLALAGTERSSSLTSRPAQQACGPHRRRTAEPRLTALVILDRLAARSPGQFGPPQHTIVQRLLKDLRREAAGKSIAEAGTVAAATAPASKAAIFSRSKALPLLPLLPGWRHDQPPPSVTLSV